MQNDLCPICECKVTRIDLPQAGRMLDVSCPSCGVFRIVTSDIPQENRYKVAAYLRKRMIYLKSRNVDEDIRPVWVVSGDSEEVNDKRFEGASINRCTREFPQSIRERIDVTLVNLYSSSKYFGEKLQILKSSTENPFWFPITFSQNLYDYVYFIDTLISMKLLESGGTAMGSSDLRLTYDAYERIDLLNLSINSKQGFIAMCQNPSVLPEWKEVQSNGFMKGIGDAGYSAISVTEHQFNGDVHEEVILQIKQSRFVVADVTGARQNVYYEAGYAEGKGIPVIYTCRNGWVDKNDKCEKRKVHFDIRQRKLIVWSDINQLATDIARRIEVTIGHGPIK